jgi:transcriptional regulator with XRE-family HTH domain
MAKEIDMDNMLSVLDGYALETTDDIALKLAEDFRRRRIEKNLTRDVIAERAGVAVSNIVRFEQKGLISLKNLIAIAAALGYTSEIKSIFGNPKYSTMEELTQIRKNTGKKKAYRKP